MCWSAYAGTTVDVLRTHADTIMSATNAVAGIKRKTAEPTTPLKAPRGSDDERWKRPHWTRGFLWSDNDISKSPSATATETTDLMPDVPLSELLSPIPNETISKNHHLFKIVTPIKVNHFEMLLASHPNWPLGFNVPQSLRRFLAICKYWSWCSIQFWLFRLSTQWSRSSMCKRVM